MAGYRHEPKSDDYNRDGFGSPHPVAARDEYESSQDVFGNEEGAAVSAQILRQSECMSNAPCRFSIGQ